MKRSVRLILLAATVCAALGARDAAFARGGGGCIEEGTPILTPSGPVPIERLKVGDEVTTGGRRKAGRVVASTRVSPEHFVEIAFPSGRLRATEEHPVATAEGAFRTAGRLRAGDRLLIPSGGRLRREAISRVRRRPAGRPAFDVIVDADGTFVAAGALVHNKGCFLPDTPILLADGGETAISDLLPGDRVLAFREDGSPVPATVQQVLTREAPGTVEVTLDRAVVRATAEHPFSIGDGAFRTLASLKAGDVVFAFDGEGVSPQRIRSLREVAGPVTVYNLLVDAPHTFFAAGIAVHNKGGCFPPGTPVLTPDGPVPIEAIRAGDAVIAVDEEGREATAAVESIHETSAPLLVVETDRGDLATTTEHPLAMADGGFREAGTLSPGDEILAWRDGGPLPATILALRRGEEGPVFTLGVGPPHTFIAGGFAVHNKGGGHGGGHRRSSSGGSSGGGGGSPFPVFVVFAILFFGFILKGRLGSKGGELDHLYSASEVAAKAKKTRALIDFIAKQDASFAAAGLEERARATFVKLQACWQARDYGPMKPLLMPDLYDQHAGQLRGMERNHEINVIEGLAVERIDLVHLRYTNRPEEREFTALITARARDYYTDDRTGDFLRGDRQAAAFQEFWTFHLGGGSWLLREIEQTAESDLLEEENFFESFTDAQLAAVYGGAVDELGRAGPWLEKDVKGKGTKISRMLQFLAETDPLWREPEMKERARQVFARVHLALEAGEAPASLAEDLSPDALADFRATLARMREEGRSIELRNLCVRKVELILIRNRGARSEDEFVARIRAHAQRIARRRGAVLHQDEDVAAFEEFWTFGRYGGAWRLQEKLPPAEGRALVGKENVEEEMGPEMLTWFYSKKRTV